MTCLICKQPGARRSRRNGLADYVLSLLGLYPWRCSSCHSRFHARLMPLSHTFRSHCPICGNLDVKRISPDFVNHPLSLAYRVLRIPAFRCEPCRHKYFSMLPQRRMEEESVRLSSTD
jgi:hypothetical protein